jgi:hypothetical protein
MNILQANGHPFPCMRAAKLFSFDGQILLSILQFK